MIRLAKQPIETLEDAKSSSQGALQLEFGTLPPYLYMLNTLLPGCNAQAAQRIKSIAHGQLAAG